MKKRILVAPLNWGLGHATRSIPIIKALITHNYTPVIASDGMALKLLQKEFPEISTIELPAYNVTYAKKAKHFKIKLFMDAPKLLKAIKAEREVTKKIVAHEGIDGIISDNRLGVYSKKVPSVFITHQLRVLTGNTTWFSTKVHQKVIKNFNVCWVPDVKDDPNLSGQLGHIDNFDMPLEYLGPLSRFNKKNTPILNDIMVLLSGPEPQRTRLESKLFKVLKPFKGHVVFVKGLIEQKQTVEVSRNMKIYNFMTSELLEKTINESALIISRSGYTTVMDLAKLNKKAFFIPTPGQFEQEYLAKRLTELQLVPSCNQDDFNLKKLDTINTYSGLKAFNFEVDYKRLFSLF